MCHLRSSSIPENVFLEFMYLATARVKFSFNNNMYGQIDGISISIPLEPVLVNIFVVFMKIIYLNVYINLRYMNYTLSVFHSFKEAGDFHHKINSSHPSPLFPMEE